MPIFENGSTAIYYEETGSGFPLLALAPGGLSSAIDAWPRAAIDPLARYSGEFRLIAMDQRNTGRSRGPLDAVDPWGAYVAAPHALGDPLGVQRLHVIGCCIGCSYALKLIERASERVVSAVLEQPIGLVAENREFWVTRRAEWLAELMATREDIDTETAERFGVEMFDRDFVGAVSRNFVATVRQPLLVLPGVDDIHPTDTGLEIAELAPGAELLQPWKDEEHLEVASAAVLAFLQSHSPV